MRFNFYLLVMLFNASNIFMMAILQNDLSLIMN